VRIEQAVQAPIEPALSSQGLALGAMAITAGIVDRALEPAVAADLQVTPESGGATASDVAEHPLLLGGQGVAVHQLGGS
jgi:hypothetical protein